MRLILSYSASLLFAALAVFILFVISLQFPPGYKIYGTNDAYSFKTRHVDNLIDGELIVDGLKRNTKYVIIVQAFNTIGSGPKSTEIVAKTLDMDPPPTPSLSVGQISFTTIELVWRIGNRQTNDHSDDHAVVSSYLVYVRKESVWEERQIPGQQLSSFTLTDLNCGTQYQFYIVAVNPVGRSEASQVITAKTKGSSKQSFNCD